MTERPAIGTRIQHSTFGPGTVMRHTHYGLDGIVILFDHRGLKELVWQFAGPKITVLL